MKEIKRTDIEPGDISTACSGCGQDHERGTKTIANTLEKVAICVDGIASAVEDVNGTVKKHDIILRGQPEAPHQGLVTKTQVNSKMISFNKRLIFILLTAILGGTGTVIYVTVGV